MRKSKREHRLRPFTTGVLSGYTATLILSAVGAMFLLLTDSTEALSGTVSIVVMALSCFIAGHTAGKLRRHGGLASGALCGLLYMVLPLMISLITLNVGGAMLIVKLMLCIAFGAAGGVTGVNSVK